MPCEEFTSRGPRSLHWRDDQGMDKRDRRQDAASPGPRELRPDDRAMIRATPSHPLFKGTQRDRDAAAAASALGM